MIQAAPSGPGDHAVRRRARTERDLADVAGRRVEVAEDAGLLAGVPDPAVGGRRDVVGMRFRPEP